MSDKTTESGKTPAPTIEQRVLALEITMELVGRMVADINAAINAALAGQGAK